VLGESKSLTYFGSIDFLLALGVTLSTPRLSNWLFACQVDYWTASIDGVEQVG